MLTDLIEFGGDESMSIGRRAMRRTKTLVMLAVVAGALVAFPAAANAQSTDPGDGVLVRVDGDTTIAAGENVGTVVVISGELIMEGTAKRVVLINGTAAMSGATIGTMVVVHGTVELGEGSVVTGNVWLPDSTMTVDGTARVEGKVVDDTAGYARALLILGALFALGVGVLAILSALAFAAIAPGLARKSTMAIREDFSRVVLSGLVLWIAVPAASIFLFVTVIGTPTAVAIWAFVLPAIGFVGYLVSAVLIGQLIVGTDANSAHQYRAAGVGALVLVALSLVPVLGGVVGMVAAILGGSALALLAWNSIRSQETTHIDSPTPQV